MTYTLKQNVDENTRENPACVLATFTRSLLVLGHRKGSPDTVCSSGLLALTDGLSGCPFGQTSQICCAQESPAAITSADSWTPTHGFLFIGSRVLPGIQHFK